MSTLIKHFKLFYYYTSSVLFEFIDGADVGGLATNWGRWDIIPGGAELRRGLENAVPPWLSPPAWARIGAARIGGGPWITGVPLGKTGAPPATVFKMKYFNSKAFGPFL